MTTNRSEPLTDTATTAATTSGWEQMLSQPSWGMWTKPTKTPTMQKSAKDVDSVTATADPFKMQVGESAYKTPYHAWPIQPVEFIHKNRLDFMQGCIIKYVCRFRFKNGREDLLKARHFIDMLLKAEYGEAEEASKV